MDTQQGCAYLFAKAVAVKMYRGFSRVACVCVNRNTNTEKRACYLALTQALGSLTCSLILQRLCKWSCFYSTLIGKRSHTCKRIKLIYSTKIHTCNFILCWKMLSVSQRHYILSDQISCKHSSFDFESLWSNVNFKCLFVMDIPGTTIFCWLIIRPKRKLKCSAAIVLVF